MIFATYSICLMILFMVHCLNLLLLRQPAYCLHIYAYIPRMKICFHNDPRFDKIPYEDLIFLVTFAFVLLLFLLTKSTLQQKDCAAWQSACSWYWIRVCVSIVLSLFPNLFYIRIIAPPHQISVYLFVIKSFTSVSFRWMFESVYHLFASSSKHSGNSSPTYYYQIFSLKPEKEFRTVRLLSEENQIRDLTLLR